MSWRVYGLAGATAAALLYASGAAADDDERDDDDRAFRGGDVSVMVYDGVTDDLLTAGLGKDGLASAIPPGFADPLNPTPAELRRLAIYNNYRALLDMTDSGGYGRLYGPNVTADGTVTDSQGLVPGVEYIAFAGAGRENVTMMVQIPDRFDPAEACIVTAPSSGSRGVYGAISTAGEWGLKNGCAVAYTDKGTGTGAHNLQDNTVGLITGVRADADAAGKDSTFTAKIPDRKRAAFNAETPFRFAFKHAHSGRNPEADWGQDVLDSVRFAFFALNQEYPEAELEPDNTIVIASSVSNGGGSSVLAAEQDDDELIDGVAVSEPNVNPEPSDDFTIIEGAGAPFANHSRSLYDYTTLLNIYQGCASAAAPFGVLFNLAPSPARCDSLRALGLLTSDTLAEQAAEAQAIVNAYGFLEEQNPLQLSHWAFFIPQAISVTYANTYARASVTDNVCGYSFAETDAAGFPAPLSAANEAVLFGTSNGIPPTGGIDLINNDGALGPQLDRISTVDQNLAGALCLRALATGRDPVTGERVKGKARAWHERIRQSIEAIRASGDLDETPAIFVTGRADAILPLNHTSRAYVGLNAVEEGDDSNLRYYEVLNAHHLDAFNAFPGFNERWLPLHHYYNQALDLMLDHLRDGAPLPPSQVVRTTPRGPGAPPVTVADHLPPIGDTPDRGSAIVFDGDAVRIPE